MMPSLGSDAADQAKASASRWRPRLKASDQDSERKESRRNRIACGAAAAAVFAQLVAFGANSDFLAAVFAVVELACGLIVAGVLRDDERQGIWTKAAPPAILLFAAMIWGSAPLLFSRAAVLAPDAVSLELLKLAGVGATALSGVLIGMSRTRLRLLIHLLAVGGLAYVLLALWAGQASSIEVWGQPKGAHAFRFTGTFLNANAAGCAFGMIGLLALGLTQYRLSRTDLRHADVSDYAILTLAVCASVAAFGACALTQSRAALIVSLACGAWMIMSDRKRGGARLGVRLAAGALLLAGLALGASQIASRWHDFSGDFALRFQGYGHYLALLGSHPWFGYGLGSFKLLRQSTMTSALAAALWNQGAAHLALLQAALEGGLPFAALLCLASGWMAVRIVRPRTDARRPIFSKAATAAVVLALVCSFGDIALNVPAVAALAALLFGAAWGSAAAMDKLAG
jgi:hypothetical protein